MAKIRSGHSVRGTTGTKPQGNPKAQANKRTRRRSVAVEVEPVNNAFGLLGWHLPCAQPLALEQAVVLTVPCKPSWPPQKEGPSRLLLWVLGIDRLAGRDLDCGAIPVYVCLRDARRQKRCASRTLMCREDGVYTWRRLAPRECLDWSNSA